MTVAKLSSNGPMKVASDSTSAEFRHRELAHSPRSKVKRNA